MQELFANRLIKLTALALALLMHVTASADQPLRHFDVYEVPEAGLNVYSPGSPKWNIKVDERGGTDAIVLSTPANYFPPTSVEIRLNEEFVIGELELNAVATEVTKALRKKINASSLAGHTLQPIQYGPINAIKDEFNITYQNQDFTIRHIIGRMPSGHIITMMASTPINQIDAIEFMLEKIYSNLKEI